MPSTDQLGKPPRHSIGKDLLDGPVEDHARVQTVRQQFSFISQPEPCGLMCVTEGVRVMRRTIPVDAAIVGPSGDLSVGWLRDCVHERNLSRPTLNRPKWPGGTASVDSIVADSLALTRLFDQTYRRDWSFRVDDSSDSRSPEGSDRDPGPGQNLLLIVSTPDF